MEEEIFELPFKSQMYSTDFKSTVQEPSKSTWFRGKVADKEEWMVKWLDKEERMAKWLELECLDIFDNVLPQEAHAPTAELGGARDECAAAPVAPE